MKEIPLHQEMVSVTCSVTWTSHGSSVIGINPDPRCRRDKIARYRYRPEKTKEAVRQSAQRRKADATLVLGSAVRGRLPRFTDRCEKKTESDRNRPVSLRSITLGREPFLSLFSYCNLPIIDYLCQNLVLVFRVDNLIRYTGPFLNEPLFFSNKELTVYATSILFRNN